MRERKCCDECSRRRKKVSECRPRGPGRKCWSCAKWVRDCSFVRSYPAALLGLKIELSREERRQQRTAEFKAIAVEKGIVTEATLSAERAAPRYELAAAVANAAASALRGEAGEGEYSAADSEAAGLAPGDAAQMALVAWAAASSHEPRAAKRAKTEPLELLADTARRQGARSVVLRVPEMMCLGSCGATIERALGTLPFTSVAGINVQRRLLHCHTRSPPEDLVEQLTFVGFEASVVSVSKQTAPLANGELRELIHTHYDEWDVADALGLVSSSCARRNGGDCSCGPSCMCHYCPTHHPARAASLGIAADPPGRAGLGERRTPPLPPPAQARPGPSLYPPSGY